jgi:7,8-dihydropterin-6-yl-methyl-4-(beta-D-ribofuranosyl)aminobenzene 5'-phosphate synthase
MSNTEDFGQTSAIEITVLVDNRADLIVKSTDAVKRFTDEPLLAEHGFAALVDLKGAGVRILWDAGISQIVLLENARRMGIDLSTVDKIALSHGHRDHYASMTSVIQQIAKRPEPREWPKGAPLAEIREWAQAPKVPFIAHPAAFRERWGIGQDGKKYGPHLVPRAEWEAAGAEIILSSGPYRLGPGCWTTGTIPRRSFERAGTPSSMAYRQGDEFPRDHLEDDQSIVINLEGKGLVVLTGCAHSGVVNTVRFAQELSGVDEILAIVGGFHLGPARDDEIDRTVDEIIRMGPKVVAPSHCTGFKAIAQFADRMPDAFVLGVVGTRYLF